MFGLVDKPDLLVRQIWYEATDHLSFILQRIHRTHENDSASSNHVEAACTQFGSHDNAIQLTSIQFVDDLRSGVHGTLLPEDRFSRNCFNIESGAILLDFNHLTTNLSSA